ncbi:MAG: hypothetical protein JO324_00050 [Candidatus Eremiobacteraeota bacterium]|nr:hypothetical protein [Candidatus Eremiobacteraeota bacterium]
MTYRIIVTLATRGQQTTEGLAAVLNDIPVSTLYRHLARLRAAEVIRVISERPVRGTVERTYAIASRLAAAVLPAAAAQVPLAGVRATIRNFLTAMVAEVIKTVESRSFARTRRHFHAALYATELSDEAYLRALGKISAAIREARGDSAGRKTRRFSFYVVAFPEQTS